MSSSLVPLNSFQPGALAAIADRASEFISQSKARNTVRGYKSDWAHFEFWCRKHGRVSLPAEQGTVALYVTDLAATHKPATITRRISAISQAHQIAGAETPTKSSAVRLVLAGIRRTVGTAQIAKTPVLIDDLKRHGVAFTSQSDRRSGSSAVTDRLLRRVPAVRACRT